MTCPKRETDDFSKNFKNQATLVYNDDILTKNQPQIVKPRPNQYESFKKDPIPILNQYGKILKDLIPIL